MAQAKVGKLDLAFHATQRGVGQKRTWFLHSEEYTALGKALEEAEKKAPTPQ
jgi:hypothetical protein